jgi:hypothetical protein
MVNRYKKKIKLAEKDYPRRNCVYAMNRQDKSFTRLRC